MDVPVQATVLVDHFQDQLEVQRLLGSHGFKVKDLGGGQVQIQGYFEPLRVLKVRLERLLASERSAGNGDDEGAASSSSPRRQDHGPRWSGGRQGCGGEMMVDSDVFRYARQLGSKELRDILSGSDLQTRTSKDGLSTSIRFLGTGTAVGPLQDHLDDLNKSLRTQEVPLRDLDRQGWVLLRSIQENQNVSETVLVCELEDRVHLVGPSTDSWELKQRLLGRPIDQSGARGRSGDRPASRGRSSSVGPAAGSSPSGPDPSRPPRTRSVSGAAGSSPSGPDPSRPPRTRSVSRAAGSSPSGPDPSRPPRTRSVSRAAGSPSGPGPRGALGGQSVPWSWALGQPEQRRGTEKRTCSVL